MISFTLWKKNFETFPKFFYSSFKEYEINSQIGFFITLEENLDFFFSRNEYRMYEIDFLENSEFLETEWKHIWFVTNISKKNEFDLETYIQKYPKISRKHPKILDFLMNEPLSLNELKEMYHKNREITVIQNVENEEHIDILLDLDPRGYTFLKPEFQTPYRKIMCLINYFRSKDSYIHYRTKKEELEGLIMSRDNFIEILNHFSKNNSGDFYGIFWERYPIVQRCFKLNYPLDKEDEKFYWKYVLDFSICRKIPDEMIEVFKIKRPDWFKLKKNNEEKQNTFYYSHLLYLIRNETHEYQTLPYFMKEYPSIFPLEIVKELIEKFPDFLSKHSSYFGEDIMKYFLENEEMQDFFLKIDHPRYLVFVQNQFQHIFKKYMEQNKKSIYICKKMTEDLWELYKNLYGFSTIRNIWKDLKNNRQRVKHLDRNFMEYAERDFPILKEKSSKFQKQKNE